ncbi:MAG: IS66 family transposase [Alphaproteobacteria bacterium]|nr:IS66 family transposase [Alphaproteobacteria bacterium]
MKESLEFYKDCRDRSLLPNDVEVLKDIIVYQWEVIDKLRTDFQDYRQKTDLVIDQLMKKIESLDQQVSALKRNRFGQRSEKNKTKNKPSSSLTEDAPGSKASNTVSNQNHRGRNPLPEHLERVPVEYDLKTEEKVCPDCHAFLTRINNLVTEQLDVIPAQLIVKQHVRARYACRKCYGVIKTAEMPAQPIDKGRASAELLAHLIVEKFDYYLPCYRLQRWFLRQGVDISRSTVSGWLYKAGVLLKPLVDFQKNELISCGHIFSDDTTMPTLAPGTGKTKIGRLWVYTQRPTKTHGGITIYQYTPTREGIHPETFLKGFKGYLQVDAYSGYNGLFAANDEGEIHCQEVGCWAHARRKFVELVTLHPDSVAQEVLDLIGSLYEIERQAKEGGLTDLGRRALRKKKSKPILKKIYNWLHRYKPEVVPKNPLGQAIAYAVNNWIALTRFLGDGKLEIDNNRAERKIKPIVMGRKNHLFVGGDQGGETLAIFYSVIETCRQNDVNPVTYLADVLERIPTHPNKRIEELLPYNWKKLREQQASAAA